MSTQRKKDKQKVLKLLKKFEKKHRKLLKKEDRKKKIYFGSGQLERFSGYALSSQCINKIMKDLESEGKVEIVYGYADRPSERLYNLVPRYRSLPRKRWSL